MSALTVPFHASPLAHPVNQMDQFSFLRKAQEDGDARKLFETDTAEQLMGECPASRVLLVRVKAGSDTVTHLFQRDQLAELKAVLSDKTNRVTTIWTIKPARLKEYHKLPAA